MFGGALVYIIFYKHPVLRGVELSIYKLMLYENKVAKRTSLCFLAPLVIHLLPLRIIGS